MNQLNVLMNEYILLEKMTKILTEFEMPKNYHRARLTGGRNIFFYGMVLGMVFKWNDGKGRRHSLCNRLHEERYIKLWDQTNEIFKSLLGDFKYTSIQYNYNFKCLKHKDGNNVGVSYIVGLGNYEGGDLLVYFDGRDKPPTAVNIKNRLFSFDGSKYHHETAEFTGERYSLVFYGVGSEV
tara:strand:+ start:476 stop:1018 length:543 start_codon:yes stop_codon:yes gene_type:complete